MKHALVVGEGLTALAAAQRLRAAGVCVTRVSGSGRPGSADAGLELVGERHAALDWLAGSVEVPVQLSFTPLRRVAVARGSGRSRIVPLASSGLLGIGRGAALAELWRRARIGGLRTWFTPAVDPGAPERGVRLDDRSVADFARVYVGRRGVQSLLAAILEAGLGLDDRQLSRLLLFLRLDERARLSLVRVRGIERLEAALARENPPLGAATLTAVAPGGRGATLSDGASLEADAVLLCGAPATLRKWLPALPQRADSLLSRMPEGVSWTVRMDLDRPISVPAGLWVCPRAAGGPLAGVAELGARTIVARGRPGLAGAGPEDAKRIGELLVRAASRALPELGAAHVETRVQRAERSSFAPGHWRAVAAIRDEEARWLPRQRVALAGGWQVSPDAEGRALAGLRAAERLLAL
ncbi:MAG: hypothetical protein ACE5IL_13250 [Myxococcota bacterium]